MLEDHGLPPWLEIRKKRDSSKSIKENFPIFFGKKAETAYREYINYLLAHKHEMSCFPGAMDALKFLKRFGISPIIISNRDEDFVANMVKEFGLGEHISFAMGAGRSVYSKPDKRVLEFALAAAGIPSKGEKILFVGDSLADMNCAEAAGAFPVLLRFSKTDITDEWIRAAITGGRKMWIIENYDSFLTHLRLSPAFGERQENSAIDNFPKQNGSIYLPPLSPALA